MASILLPVFKTTNSITHALTLIERARGFLEAATLSDEWLKEMRSQAFLLEAHHTTHIEGTQLTLEQSEQLLAGKKLDSVDKDDATELLNYREAFELVASYLQESTQITEGVIREIHKRLVQGVRGDSAAPGEYRTLQNFVVNSQTKEVIYTPPPAYDVPFMMTELVGWLNDEKEIHPVLVAGIAQFQLVHIHPFLDGNGRTARLLSTLSLYRHQYDFKQLFSISEFYDRNRTDYYRAIQSVRNNNMDMTEWLEYFCSGLATQLQEVKEQGAYAIKRDVIASKNHLSIRQIRALDHVFKKGSLSIQDYAVIYPDTPRRTLQRDLKELVDKNMFIASGSTNKLIYLPHPDSGILAKNG